MRNLNVYLMVGSMAGLSGWYVLAQEKSNQDSNPPRQNQSSNSAKADDRNAIEDAVRTMDSQGQLRLGGAIEIAERHAKGRAVRASVEISRVNRDNGDDNDRNDSGDDGNRSRDQDDDGRVTRGTSNANPHQGQGINQKEQDTSGRKREKKDPMDNENALIFEVLTYVDGNLHAVRIDARSRRVISDETRRTLDPVTHDDNDDQNDQGDDDRRDNDDDDRDRNQNDNRRDRDDRSDNRSDDQPKSKPDEGKQPNNPQPNNPQPTNPKDDNNEKPN